MGEDLIYMVHDDSYELELKMRGIDIDSLPIPPDLEEKFNKVFEDYYSKTQGSAS